MPQRLWRMPIFLSVSRPESKRSGQCDGRTVLHLGDLGWGRRTFLFGVRQS